MISQDPFRALAGGGPGFAATVAARATKQRETTRAWIAEYRHQTTVAWLAFGAAIAIFVVGWLSVGLLAYLVRENGTVERIDSSVARWGDVSMRARSPRARWGS